ncbi:hypothetical protein CA267_006490 [Alteromonas pelagimontana]|uniref:Uncharacterized protein n=1 Tax=Alteromonas pelagimontana TaxID=1858656 RepID=A0A6M4MD00_9ALTE|nr:hypothetical protein [Alteromonas pelagimontana]QJR80445.1 hypothetical protein CA267_006490 [Alteromonas pelagimontana]
MSVYLSAVVFVVVAFTIFYLWVMRSQCFNRPSHVLLDVDDFITIRHNALSRYFTGFAMLVQKGHISKIEVSDECLTLITDGNNAIEIWLSQRFIGPNASYARTLFPEAEFTRSCT